MYEDFFWACRSRGGVEVMDEVGLGDVGGFGDGDLEITIPESDFIAWA